MSVKYWDFFLSLEDDLERCTKYIEFCPDNFSAYSNEFAKIIISASAEFENACPWGQVLQSHKFFATLNAWQDRYELNWLEAFTMSPRGVIMGKSGTDHVISASCWGGGQSRKNEVRFIFRKEATAKTAN